MVGGPVDVDEHQPVPVIRKAVWGEGGGDPEGVIIFLSWGSKL